MAESRNSLPNAGRSDESLELCREVQKRNPTDDTVLSTLSLNFKLLDLPDEAAACYEKALEQMPGNTEMAQELFFSYVKTFNFAKMQQLAMKLNKQIPSPHFVMWSAAAVLLQDRLGAGGPMTAMQLTLAERLVKKVSEKGGEPSAEDVRVYVALLRAQKKIPEALQAVVAHASHSAVASSSSAKIDDESSLEAAGVPSQFLMMQPREREDHEVELLLESGDAEGAHTAFAALSSQSPDQWAYHRGVVDALFRGAAQWGSEAKRGEALAGARQRCWTLQEAQPEAAPCGGASCA